MTPQASQEYKAFISYAHTDEKFAQWLHRALERYRLPKKLAQRKGSKPLTPIFRDRDELSTSSDLSASIENGLASSENLIVLCSPAAVQSRWVNREIQRFRELNSPDRIFCVLLGEPSESFPSALFEKDDDGSGPRKEPLAADARESGDGKRGALLRLVAGLLGVSFDDLRQREQQRRIRNLTGVVALTGIAAVVTTSLALLAIDARQEAERHRDQSEELVRFMVGDLRDQLKPLGRLDVLVSVGDRAMRYFENLEDADATPTVLLQRGKTLNQLGEVYLDLGEQSMAVQAFSNSLEQIQRLHIEQPDDGEILFELSQAHYWVGAAHLGQCRFYCSSNDPAYLSTELHWTKYKEIAQELLSRDAENTRWTLELAWAENNLGALATNKLNYRAAARHFEASAELFDALLLNEPDSDLYLMEIANVLVGLTVAQTSLGFFSEAQATAARAVTLARKISAPIQRSNALDYVLGMKGSSDLQMGNLSDAVSRYSEALTHSRSLLDIDPDNATWKFAFSRSALQLANALRLANQPWVETYEQGRLILDELMTSEEPYTEWTIEHHWYKYQAARYLAKSDDVPSLVEINDLFSKYPNAVRIWSYWLLLVLDGLEVEEQQQLLERMKMVLTERMASSLRPKLQLALAEVLYRSGDRLGAKQQLQALSALGYRHPDLAEISKRLKLSDEQ